MQYFTICILVLFSCYTCSKSMALKRVALESIDPRELAENIMSLYYPANPFLRDTSFNGNEDGREMRNAAAGVGRRHTEVRKITEESVKGLLDELTVAQKEFEKEESEVHKYEGELSVMMNKQNQATKVVDDLSHSLEKSEESLNEVTLNITHTKQELANHDWKAHQAKETIHELSHELAEVEMNIAKSLDEQSHQKASQTGSANASPSASQAGSPKASPPAYPPKKLPEISTEIPKSACASNAPPIYRPKTTTKKICMAKRKVHLRHFVN